MKTRTITRTGLAVALTLAALAPSTVASAAGGGAVVVALPSHAKQELREHVARARTADPEAFRAVQRLAVRAKDLDRRARGGRAPLALYLDAMGERALMPMLEMLAGSGSSELAGDDGAAARIALVEAVGLRRDPRAMPVLRALLEREGDARWTRATAEAVARMGTDEAALLLEGALAKATGAREKGILAGMGACRRVAIARTLARRLGARPDDETARVIVQSLGAVGNEAAWRTLAPSAEEAEAREVAATALVQAYVAYTGDVRQAASNALMVVDNPHTDALLGAARDAAPREAREAIEELASRFARNPVRVR